MEPLLDSSAVRIGLMLAGALAALIVLRSTLRVTARLLKIGCLSLAGVALALWLVTWVT